MMSRKKAITSKAIYFFVSHGNRWCQRVEKIASMFPKRKDRKDIHLHLTAHMGNNHLSSTTVLIHGTLP